VSEQGDQWKREQEGHGGPRSPGGTSRSPSGDDREDREEGNRQGNRESGIDESGSQQGDVAHEGDLPTEAVPEAD
jgi:hypothetical protein